MNLILKWIAWLKKNDVYDNTRIILVSDHGREIRNTLLKKNDAVLDVGCGSGILSIACAKLEALVDICDTDEVALKSSSTNFALNNVAFGNSWVGSASMATKEYDVVLANIIADVLIMISKDLKNNLKQGGYLILSGIWSNSFSS